MATRPRRPAVRHMPPPLVHPWRPSYETMRPARASVTSRTARRSSTNSISQTARRGMAVFLKNHPEPIAGVSVLARLTFLPLIPRPEGVWSKREAVHFPEPRNLLDRAQDLHATTLRPFVPLPSDARNSVWVVARIGREASNCDRWHVHRKVRCISVGFPESAGIVATPRLTGHAIPERSDDAYRHSGESLPRRDSDLSATSPA